MNIQGEQLECNKALIDKYRSEYLLLPEKERKQHTCISFLTFIFTGNAVPYLDPNLWQGEECKIEDIKEGDAIVFSRCKESNINHCVICIAQGRFLSKELKSMRIQGI